MLTWDLQASGACKPQGPQTAVCIWPGLHAEAWGNLRDQATQGSYNFHGIRRRARHRTLGFNSARSAISRSRRITQHANDGALDDYDDSTSNDAIQLPPLPANEALAQAVSQVQIQMDGWAPLHIFKLFVVLVEPPPGLDLSAIEGLRDYLAELLVAMGNLINNGIREIASHCWRALLGRCSTPNISWV